MSIFIIGNHRLSSQGYLIFHALYYKANPQSENLFQSNAIQELVRTGLAAVDKGLVQFTEAGNLLAYLFYTAGEIRGKSLTKFCNWATNETLMEILAMDDLPVEQKYIREITEFTWWINHLRNAIVFEIVDLPACNKIFNLTLESLAGDPPRFKLTGVRYPLVV